MMAAKMLRMAAMLAVSDLYQFMQIGMKFFSDNNISLCIIVYLHCLCVQLREPANHR
jgi:hypothetical protein